MSLNGILKLLDRHPEFSKTLDQAACGAAKITVRQGARAAFIASLAQRSRSPLLVVAPRPEDARRLHDQLLTWMGDDGPVHLLPEPEVLPFERLAVDGNTGNQRLGALAALASARDHAGSPEHDQEPSLPPLVVCSIGSALLYTAPAELMAGNLPSTNQAGRPSCPEGTVWKVGDRVRLDGVLSQWVQLGYRHEPVVDSPGSFSHRGGILDIYPPDCDLPLRIEFFDDEIDTIRRFDPLTQRSVGSVNEVRPIPAREQLPGAADPEALKARAASMDFSRCSEAIRERMEEELQSLIDSSVPESNPEILSFYSGLINRTSLLDYLGAEGTVLLERGGRVEAEASELEERFQRMRAAREDRGELPANFPSPCMDWEDFVSMLGNRRVVELQTWVGDDEDQIFLPATPYYGSLEQLSADIKRRQGESTALVAVTQHARRLAEILEQQGISALVEEELQHAPEPGQVCIIPGSLRDGWAVELPAGPATSTRQSGRERGKSWHSAPGHQAGPADGRRVVRHGQGTPPAPSQAGRARTGHHPGRPGAGGVRGPHRPRCCAFCRHHSHGRRLR